MGLVFELAIPLKPKMVLLKYADHADPDGRNAWPSVRTVSRGCSIPERTTARIIKTLKALTVLQPDNRGFGGRKERPKGQSYRIDIEMASKIGPEQWIKAYSKVNEQGDKTSATKVADVYAGGAPAPGSETSATQMADVSDAEPMPNEDEPLPYGPETSATQVADKPYLTLEPKTESPDGDSSAPGGAPAPSPDLKSRIFGPALDWLAQQTGRPKDKLRSMVGRWCRDHGDGQVLEAFAQAARCGAIEPVAWIERTLKEEGHGKRPGNRDGPTAGQAAAAAILGRDLGP
jgi:hypothetical protein